MGVPGLEMGESDAGGGMNLREPTKNSKSKDPMAKLRAKVADKLSGFSDAYPDWESEPQMTTGSADSARFPVPELILFTLRNVMGWKWSGEGEKVRWTVYGSVDGEPVFFSLRKFGLKVGHKVGGKVPLTRIEGQLTSAVKVVEAFLEPIAEHQIAKGEVLIVNRFSEFDSRYRFFREKADEAFKRAKTKPRKSKKAKPEDGDGLGFMSDFVAEMNRSTRLEREGFVYSVAMVDCYFSALEHRLVLLRAFTGRPIATGELVQLLRSKWDDKLDLVTPVAGNRKLQLLLGQLREIKERVRNPFAHGGVENDGGSMFFHLPTVGAVPANFSRFGKSVRFSHIPVGQDAHTGHCRVFDELDAVLSTGGMSRPHRLLDGGIDPSFDAESLQSYATAVAGTDEDVEQFIHGWSDMWMRHANMDY